MTNRIKKPKIGLKNKKSDQKTQNRTKKLKSDQKVKFGPKNYKSDKTTQNRTKKLQIGPKISKSD